MGEIPDWLIWFIVLHNILVLWAIYGQNKVIDSKRKYIARMLREYNVHPGRY